MSSAGNLNDDYIKEEADYEGIESNILLRPSMTVKNNLNGRLMSAVTNKT